MRRGFGGVRIDSGKVDGAFSLRFVIYDHPSHFSGSGVVGGAVALVKGLIAMALGGLAPARSHRTG
jgi:hypothetical protein